MRIAGRSAELAVIGDFLVDATRRPAHLVITGEAGIGKSALLTAAVESANSSGFTILNCRCADTETALGYAALTDLMAPVADDLSARLPAPQRQALDIALVRVEPGEEMIERHSVGRAVLAGLQHLAQRAPVLLVVDEVQWLDSDTAQVLGFALRRLEIERVAFVGTLRSGTRPPGEIEDVLRRAQRMNVGPMSPAELESMLAKAVVPPPPRGLLRRVHDLSGGNPLYALELCRTVAASGPIPDEAVPPSLQDLLRERLAALPQLDQDVLAAAALIAAPTRPAVAAAVAKRQRTVDAAIDAALTADLLYEDAGRLIFTHPLLAIAATSSTPHNVRRQINHRLAAVAQDSEERARHLALAVTEPDEDVAVAIEVGARRARSRAAPDVAAELGDAAVRLTPSHLSDALTRRRVEAAYHHVAAGAVDAGLVRMTAALRGVGPDADRTDLLWRCAMLYFLSGDVKTCIEHLDRALAESIDSDVQAMIRRRLASMLTWASRFREARDTAAAALHDADVLDVREELSLEATLSMAAYMLGETIDASAITRLEQLSERCGIASAQENWIVRTTPLVMAVRGADSVRRVIEPVYRRAVEEADDLGTAWSGGRWAEVEIAAGRWPHAAELADASLRAAQRAASPAAMLFALEATATVSVHRGDIDGARAAAKRLLDPGERLPALWRNASAHAVLGFAALSMNDCETALAEFSLVEAGLDALEVAAPRVPFLRWHYAQACFEAGDLSGAEKAAQRLADYGVRADDPLVLATSARVRGLLNGARGDVDAACVQMEAALHHHDRLSWPFELGLTELAYGQVLRRARRNKAAREHLTSAQTIFNGLGASLWSAQVEVELGRIGGRTARAGTLTNQEARVAELAVQGLTNREIAERLFVSTKTVATHLSNAYAKLAVRSRTELARRLGDLGRA